MKKLLFAGIIALTIININSKLKAYYYDFDELEEKVDDLESKNRDLEDKIDALETKIDDLN